MDAGNGRNGGVEDETSYRRSGKRKKQYHRHSIHQIQQLEAFHKHCPSPDEGQRAQLSIALGLAPSQIKFWFQNKRTQAKTQSEKMKIDELRAENKKLQRENVTLSRALSYPNCLNCDGQYLTSEERARQRFYHILLHENISLRDEYNGLLNMLASIRRQPPPGI